MSSSDTPSIKEIFNWCSTVLGAFEVISDDSREHPGERASSFRLRTPSGNCYVKMHRDTAHWESEVHGYEMWAPAFGDFAPLLLAVRDEAPLALIISELDGKIMEGMPLSIQQERTAWQAAGQALARLHHLDQGAFFGACHRDGSPVGAPINDTEAYISACFDDWIERGKRIQCLSDHLLAVIRAACEFIPAFAGEHPTACHRDFCPANWLVSDGGVWTGVIDFEFSYWDVRSADFTRLPNWEWVHRPDLLAAFFEGYGRSFTAREEQQHLVSQALYALGAIVWGMENAYFIYAREGQEALEHLGKQLR